MGVGAYDLVVPKLSRGTFGTTLRDNLAPKGQGLTDVNPRQLWNFRQDSAYWESSKIVPWGAPIFFSLYLEQLGMVPLQVFRIVALKGSSGLSAPSLWSLMPLREDTI